MDTVNQIKEQYARVLRSTDWWHFKKIAEYYLRTAARLKKRNISSEEDRLLLRNSQKRLFLGIGCELLLKAYYLKEGYCINKFLPAFEEKNVPSHKLEDVPDEFINQKDTFTMNLLIDNMNKIKAFDEFSTIKRGLQVAMTFRNKEGHVTFPRHEFDLQNYRDIEEAVRQLHKQGFGEELEFTISVQPKEAAQFNIQKMR